MMNTADFHAAVAAVCPIVGVSLANYPPKTAADISIQFDATATPAQKAAAISLAASFDFNAVDPKQSVLAPYLAKLDASTFGIADVPGFLIALRKAGRL